MCLIDCFCSRSRTQSGEWWCNDSMVNHAGSSDSLLCRRESQRNKNLTDCFKRSNPPHSSMPFSDTHSHTHTHTDTHTNTHTNARTHTRTQTQSHTRPHTHAHAHISPI